MSQSFKFLKSARLPNEWPDVEQTSSRSVWEIVFLGRSNSGKSSMLNRIAGSQIAKVSSSPGKTRLLNFFQGPKYRIVDVPGYGYSSRSGDEQSEWSQMIEPYLMKRDVLKGAVLLMDSRRKWSEDEGMLGRFLRAQGVPVGIALTKWDKLNQKEQSFALKQMKESMLRVKSWKPHFIMTVSSSTGQGVRELEDAVYRSFIHESYDQGPEIQKDIE